MDITSYISYLPQLSADWIILGALALFFTFDSLRSNSSRVSALAIAITVAFLISDDIATSALLGTVVASGAPAVQTGLFIALTVCLFIALYRIVDFGPDSTNLFQALIAGVSAACISIIILMQLPESTLPWHFGDQFAMIFGESYRLYWMVASYFGLAISRG